MVQTGNGTAVAAADGRKTREGVPKLLACVVLVGISWAMVVCNIIINIRNGQRLSIDDHGWLMNGVIVGTLSLAPTAAVGFAGYRWGRQGLGGPGDVGRGPARRLQSMVGLRIRGRSDARPPAAPGTVTGSRGTPPSPAGKDATHRPGT